MDDGIGTGSSGNSTPHHHQPPRSRNLGDLPDELLIHILSLLPAQRDLCSVCLVSHRLNSIADPVLYKSLLFDQPKHHLTFSESLITRPRRGSLIQNVHFDYPSSGSELSDVLCLMCLKDRPNRIHWHDCFSYTVSTMSNLENLVVSVPESLCRGIGNLFNGPFDLAYLKSCSLFYQREDGGYWDLQENIHIFSHPTLESLTIRRAKLDERGFESLEKPSETALKELHLIECDINDDALSDLLLLPEALIEVTITQLEVPSPPLVESPSDVEGYIEAFRSAQHSLESISIDFATLSGESALLLREFDELKSLQLRDYQLFGQSSGSPRLHSVGLPPNLEVVTFLGPVGEDEEVAELLGYAIENKAIVARKWSKMVVDGGAASLPPKIAEACAAAENFELLAR